IEAVKELAGKVNSLAATVAGFAQDFTSANGHFTNTLCVGDTCITGSQLQQLLQASGQQSSAPPIVEPIIVDTTSPPTSGELVEPTDETDDSDTATSTDPIVTDDTQATTTPDSSEDTQDTASDTATSTDAI
ncbi:MAG: hypothetical protein WC887_03215, partial [Candidatus Paceibacterota bacterium]